MSRAPILDRSFVWIPSASHDADSTEFRKRQRARMAAAKAAAAEVAIKVQPIGKKRTTA